MKIVVLLCDRRLDALVWMLQNPMGLGIGSKLECILCNATDQDKDDVEGWFERIEADFKLQLSPFKWTPQLIRSDKFGLGHGVKAFCRDLCPSLIVAPKARHSRLGTYLAQCQSAPVVFAQPRLLSKGVVEPPYQRILVLANSNPESHETFRWMCQNVHLPSPSGLFIVHGYNETEGLREYETLSDKEAKAVLRQRHREILKQFAREYTGKVDAKTALVRIVSPSANLARSTMQVFLTQHPPKDVLEAAAVGGIVPLKPSPDLWVVSPILRRGFKTRYGGRFTSQIMEQDADILVFKTPALEHNKPTPSKQSSVTDFPASISAAPPMITPSPVHHDSGVAGGESSWWGKLPFVKRKSFSQARARLSVSAGQEAEFDAAEDISD